MHLLRPLGGDQQVDAELAPLGGDAHGHVGREPLQRVGGSCGADVVGLVDDDEHRPRSARRAQRRVSTDAATSDRSSAEARLPRSTTRQRQSSPSRSSRRPGSSRPRGPERPLEQPEVADPAAERARVAAIPTPAARGSPRGGAPPPRRRPRRAAPRTPRGRASGSSPATAAFRRGVEVEEAQVQERSAPSAAERTAMPGREGPPARREPPGRHPRARRPAGRSPSWGRGPRCAGRSRAAAAPAPRRASRTCPSPTGRRGTCGGRTRPRRAPRRLRGRAAARPIRSRARAGATARHPVARPRPARRARSGASWKGAASPSTTPWPGAPAEAHRGGEGGGPAPRRRSAGRPRGAGRSRAPGRAAARPAVSSVT